MKRYTKEQILFLSRNVKCCCFYVSLILYATHLRCDMCFKGATASLFRNIYKLLLYPLSQCNFSFSYVLLQLTTLAVLEINYIFLFGFGPIGHDIATSKCEARHF